MAACSYIPAISIRLVLEFTGREGIFTYLSKEWKDEYVSMYGFHSLSPSILRSVDRYRWACEYGGYYPVHTDIDCILNYRMDPDDIESESIGTVLAESYGSCVIEYALYNEDEDLWIRLKHHSLYGKQELLDYALWQAVYHNSLDVLNDCCEMRNNAEEPFEALQLAARLGRIYAIRQLMLHYDFSAFTKRTCFAHALMNGQIEIAEFFMIHGVKYFIDLLPDVIEADSLAGFRFLHQNGLIQQRDKRQALLHAVAHEAMNILNFMLQLQVQELRDLKEAYSLADHVGNGDAMDLLREVIAQLEDDVSSISTLSEDEVWSDNEYPSDDDTEGEIQGMYMTDV